MNGLTATEVSDCLSVEASANFAQTASIKAMYEHCQAKKKKLISGQDFSSTFNERSTEVIGGDQNDVVLFLGGADPSIYNSWINSLKTMPDVVKYNLKPLHTILPNGHKAWNGLNLLSSCSFSVRRGRVSESCMFKHGSFYFSYEVQCAPSLGGSQCDEYISSPMNPSLAKVFYTRNGVLAGDAEKINVNSTHQSG